MPRRRLVHILIVALNFFEGNFGWKDLRLLGRRPAAVHRRIHQRLWALVIACDDPEAGAMSLVPGRSGLEFIGTLMQLEHFAKRCNIFDTKGYGDGPRDSEKKEVGVFNGSDEPQLDHQPYTNLNAQVGRIR